MSHRTFDDPDSDEARQALLDNRCEARSRKRHRTKGRRIRMGAAKKRRIKHALAIRAKSLERYHAAVRAYWTGASDVHP